MLFTHFAEYTSARQTGFRPDLLPSGLYRRSRSFTGSWGLQAFYALSADCTGYLTCPRTCRFTFLDSLALARAFPTTPRGLYRRLGIGKARNQLLPSPCPEGRAFTHRILTLRCCETQDGWLFDMGHCHSECLWACGPSIGTKLKPSSPPRKRGSTSANWIPAFAGMT
jgi:hypothetical protein